MSSPSSTSLDSQPNVSDHGIRVNEATYSGTYAAAGGCRSTPDAMTQAPREESWDRTISNIKDQVQNFSEKIEFLEDKIEEIRVSMQQQRRAQRPRQSPSRNLPLTNDVTMVSSPTKYGSLSPAPPSINQQPSRNEEDGESLFGIRQIPLSSGVSSKPCCSSSPQEADEHFGDAENYKGPIGDNWAYETGVDHSTFSSMRRDGASEQVGRV